MGNLQALGIQELAFEEQRALVGGEGFIMVLAGWGAFAIGVVGGGIANLVEWFCEAPGEIGRGFTSGYAVSRDN